jgi:tetratricopeptide (TPR) repeat protein
LLELAHFRQGHEAYSMIEDAVEKFKSALKLDEKRHDALWCLGNAYTSQGFLSASADVSEGFFVKAGECFQKAVDMEPTNESYKRALEMSAKAPQLYAELQKQLAAANAQGGGASEASKPNAAEDSQPGSDFWYDVAGWVCLVGIGFGIAALSNRSSPTSA